MMPYVIPVSYTHLDVYKRQVHIDTQLYPEGTIEGREIQKGRGGKFWIIWNVVKDIESWRKEQSISKAGVCDSSLLVGFNKQEVFYIFYRQSKQNNECYAEGVWPRIVRAVELRDTLPDGARLLITVPHLSLIHI